MQKEISMVLLTFLIPSPYNVRTIAPDEAFITELANNIAQQGLLQNLVVHPIAKGKGKGKYGVAAGNSRLLALQKLLKDGVIDKDFMVPVQIIEEAEAVEASLTENAQRRAMHPFDQVNAFKLLADKGHSAEYIADRLGYSTLHVLKCLKIAGMSPVLLDKLAHDRITLAHLQALSVCNDHERQLAIWESAIPFDVKPADLRRRATEKQVSSKAEIVKFIGLDCYKAAGGEVIQDLFADECFLVDLNLLDRLVDEKLNQIGQQIQEAEGWAFFIAKKEVTWSEWQGYTSNRVCPDVRDFSEAEQSSYEKIEHQYNDLQEQYEDMEEEDASIEAQLEKLIEQMQQMNYCREIWSDDVRSKTGVLVYLENGRLDILRGIQNAEPQTPKASKAANDDDYDGTEESEPVVQPKKAKAAHSAKLTQYLTAHRSAAIQCEIMARPEKALLILLFNMINQVFGHFGVSDSFHMRFADERHGLVKNAPDLETSKAFTYLDTTYSMWNGKIPKSKQERMEWVETLETEEQAELFAFCVALCVSSVKAEEKYVDFSEYDFFFPDMNISEYWQPNAENYFSHLSKNEIVKCVSDAFSPETANKLLQMKKSEAASEAERLFNVTGWQPEPMRAKKS